ncbi:RNA polymerase sigma factor [Maribellus maritimus]|uniref:RNA polymerase sigma factor n=1 Tax=Maribellus maritimus TaxID=2870838 RepID=UPI001EEA0DBC|nr:sigma-70 family RNA polymerase sigma factor [Maribellus maritimus]MCG6188768.1 sigma-70 family RNA polymerase sigma factor [Maribellus maritimus]
MKKQFSDEMLMKKLAAGEKRSAGILYDRNYKNVYGYFYRMTRNAEASRDLTQNVFVKILKYSHSWKDDKVFAYWLFRIARNILIDYYNEKRKFYGEDNDLEVAEFDQEESMREQDTKEKFEFLIEAMSQLPPAYREMIELNRFQGFSYKEIADTISSTENAVKVKTFRAIQKLKEIYTKIIIE